MVEVDDKEVEANDTGIRRVACIGAGTVGSGWAAACLARGLDVVAWDPSPHGEAALRRNVDDAWPSLEWLGLVPGASRERLSFASAMEDAASAADFIQESAPDDEPLKIDLLRAIDAACDTEVVIASSSSKFLPSRLASRCARPERVLVGHPFVPVQIVPLVEVVGGEQTGASAIERARSFYAALGKRPLVLKREIEAYIANRLQAVVFEEAKQLVALGVCDYDDVDKAVNWGPGLRWPIIGPVTHRHLGGGKGGVRHMIAHFGWKGPEEQKQAFIEAVEARWGHVDVAELERWRDENLITMLKHLTPPP